MARTYVFDFYNLYLPDGAEYRNGAEDIWIRPLDTAEVFEANRQDPQSKYYEGDWKTAKCHIAAETEENAVEVAEWLAFLFSFAQSRRAYWDTYYPHNEGYNGKTTVNNRVPPISHRKIPVIRAAVPLGNNRVDPFIDAALEQLRTLSETERGHIFSTINLYLSSKARDLFASKFLFAWIALESNANRNYSEYLDATGNDFVSSAARDTIQEQIRDAVHDALPDDTAATMENRLTRDHLYEHRKRDKIKIYLDHLFVDFDDGQVLEILRDADRIRNEIAHEFYDRTLLANDELLFKLHRLLVLVIFDMLDISESLLRRLILFTSADEPEVTLPSGVRIHGL